MSEHVLELETRETLDVPSSITVVGATQPTAICPDCGMESAGAYCSNCGEEMEPALPAIGFYLKEILSEFLAFDSKVGRTLPMLLLHPGQLTLEYIAGRRKRYLLPSRLYILVAFAAFFAIGYYVNGAYQDFMASPNHGVTVFEYHFRGIDLKGKDAEAFLGGLIKLVCSVMPYVILLICAPLFATFLKVLYRKQHRMFVEHLVFTLHLFSAALITQFPTFFTGDPYIKSVLFLILMVYSGRAMYRVYGDSGWRLARHYTLASGAALGIMLVAGIATIGIAFGIGILFHTLPTAAHISGT